ncbi:Manganese ABC transporter substrate-binding lipoprotein [Corynebacterium provencense]|jgi:zinc/manganese transport system substrate-binding protein|uniref:Manganese ABC transporter substrate-binding lipoprotein n=1 Tax=Corynebacterium provencense TaxID=1737425 RepID=A0A2Z3YWN7_9CORY|nr:MULTISPECIES: zinc ABC transporter substrate-binding protein [Corynebacterium]AWT26974.1 Manganese ABC transporter substrate-binding lipoprotein [Corynebacterium provencense]
MRSLHLTARATRTALVAAAALTLTGASLTACSGGSGDPAADNADLHIVASTAVWGSVAREVVDDARETGSDLDVTVTTILSGTDGDPHEYEATAKDIADIRDADIVIGNGAGYDNWLTDNAAPDAEVITAAPTTEGHDTGEHDHAGDDHSDSPSDGHGDSPSDDVNPHVWFDLATVRDFADRLASSLHGRDSSFPDHADGVAGKLDDAGARLGKLPAADVLLTEPVAADLLKNTKLRDVTPEGFAHATLNESEPSAADLTAARDLISDGTVDILVTNTQAQTPAATRLVEAAQDKGLPDRDAVVNVNESPDNGQTYFDYLDNVVTALEKAAGPEEAGQ